MVAQSNHTRVVRHQTELGRWELVLREPAQELRAYVRDYQGYIETMTQPVCRRELPSGDVALIINFGSAYRLIDPRHPAAPVVHRRSFLAGLDDSYALSESTGTAYCLQVNFTPIGAYRFFHLPMHALARRVIALEDIVGAIAHRLEERLYSAPNWNTRFAILDAFIAMRLDHAPPPSATVALSVRRLHETGGGIEIGRLAAEVGWSRKHLIAQFHEQIGLPPKLFARILRFNRALRLLNHDDAVSWPEIAQQCGYYDQAHLIKDFRELGGFTPTELRRHRVPDGGVIES